MPTPDAIPDLALVGAGYWGRNLARNFAALGALHVICDANEETLASYADTCPRIIRTAQFEDVLADGNVTKVAIAAPAALHGQLAEAALMAGKDVFVEKPLCLDVAHAERLVALAKEKGRVLMVGHLLQYHPCVQKLQALLAQGELGKLEYITSNRLNLGKIRREENALWSFAPHDLSVILSLVGNLLPEQVRCTGAAYLNDGVPDTSLTILKFAGGIHAHVYVSWLNPFKEQKLTVVGSEGMIVFDDTRPWKDKLVIHRRYLTWANGQTPTPNRSDGEALEVSESEPLRQECAHFLECCRTRRTPRTSGEEGLRVLQVLAAAQQSLEHDGEAAHPGRLKTKLARPNYFAHPTAVIDEGAEIGEGTKIWHFCHISAGAKIGKNCIFGQNCFVAPGVVIGDNVKVQNNVSIYTGAVIESDVFLGPSCVLTNVTNPRSQISRHSLYEKTVIKRGATVGANATIVCGTTIGRYCFIAAGAVVTKDVPDYALMAGVPARQKGWMSRHGHPLKPSSDGNGPMVCPESGLRYELVSRPSAVHSALRTPHSAMVVRCLDLGEEEPLPVDLATGHVLYDSFKSAKPAGMAALSGAPRPPIEAAK